MNIIVFGGSGFLGSHVVDALVQHGHQVTVFDIRESCWFNSKHKFFKGDILNTDHIKEAMKGQDIVYQMAGISDIDECHERPIDTIKLNILGTVNILQECVEANIKKIIFASSSYVYSNTGSFYRVSKQSCELLLESWQEKYGIDYVILRYGSLYGPRSDERNSIFKILHQAIGKKKIAYHGTGDEKREFIHVKDAADLSVKALQQEYKNQHIILTGNESIRYRDLLEMIREMMNEDIEINYINTTSSTHYKFTPYSFSPKLGKKLVNNPHIDLGQGLLGLIGDIYKDNRLNAPKKHLLMDKHDFL